MTPQRPSTRRSRNRFGLILALGGSLLMACGGNPASTVAGNGAANLPPQTNPGVTTPSGGPNATVPTQTLAGSVIDAVTGEPVSDVTMFVEGVATTTESTPIPRTPVPKEGIPTEAPAGAPAASPSVSASPAHTSALRPLMQLADAGVADFTIADLPAGTSPAPGAIPSLPPGVSPPPGGIPSLPPGVSPPPGEIPSLPPGVSPPPGGTPAATGAATPAASAAPQAAAGSPTPGPAGTPYPLKSLKVDSNGKFELKELPQGTYAITFWAPGYEAQTIEGALPTTLQVQLRPLDLPKKQLHDLKAVVRTPNAQPAENVEVEASSVLGKAIGDHTTSDDKGTAALSDLVAGNYAVAAWTTGLDGEIDQFALVKEVPVSVGREKRTVSPTLVLQAVTDPLLFAGTVESADAADKKKKKASGVKPMTVRAYVRVGEGEIPIATTHVGADGYFRLRLPQLPDGASYHLVASGATESGQTVYLHKYDLTEPDPKLDLVLPDPATAIAVDDPSKTPSFSWSAQSSDVAAYRVSLETVGDDSDTIWEGWTTGTAIKLPASTDLKLLKEGESYRYSLTAIKLGDKGKLDLATINDQPWQASMLTRPETFEVAKLHGGKAHHGPAKPSPAPADEQSTGKETGDAGTAGTVSPAAPSNPRIKPMSDL